MSDPTDAYLAAIPPEMRLGYVARDLAESALGVAEIHGEYRESPRVIWLATDLGLLAGSVIDGRTVLDLTLWHDVKDVELRVAIASGRSVDADYTLSIQYPRLVATGTTEAVAQFCRAVARLASAAGR